MHVNRGVSAGVLVAVLFAGGCGSDSGDAGGTPAGGTTSSESSPTETPAATTTTTTAPAGGAISVASTSLGDVLVGPDGRTLYMFDPDKQADSTCYDQCAQAWPPLAGDVEAGTGLEAAKFGTVERTDGSSQATYNKWPLYYFAKDAKAGDVTGQGVKNVWWVLSPAGEPIK